MKVRLRKLLTFILAVALAIPSGFAIQEGGEVKHAKAAEQYKWYCKECGKEKLAEIKDLPVLQLWANI